MLSPLLVLLSTSPALTPIGGGTLPPTELFPYGSGYFSSFVNASYGSGVGSEQFYEWVDRAITKSGYRYPDRGSRNLEQLLDSERKTISSDGTLAARAKGERRLAIWVHRAVKKIMPNFNLDSGFEFRNCVGKGQRQCFLQSVLIAACLQRAGVNAGVVMVNRNILGQETNNKHAVCLVRLASRDDVIVDASEDYAFAKQQGIFGNSAHGYRFLRPIYDHDFTINAFTAYTTRERLSVADIQPMPRKFIESQFDYYRGERTSGGVMAKHKTMLGLEAAQQFLARSVSEDPDNSLSQYMLGRVFLYRGQREPAARSLDRAMRLYSEQGWVPPDERTSQARAHHYS